MRLDSARELKVALSADFTVPVRPRRSEIGDPDSFILGDLSARRLGGTTELPALALGVRSSGRRPNDYVIAARIQDRTLVESPMVARIRQRSRNEADVRYVGPVLKQVAPWQQRRHRPLMMGVSVGHVAVTAGTLGAFVRRRRGRSVEYLLSNNHVLADENIGISGDGIVQQGRADGGTPSRSTVAHLEKFVPLRFGGQPNMVDAAIARVIAGVAVDRHELRGAHGPLAGIANDIPESEGVAKIGRTTGYTEGVVSAFELDGVRVQYDGGLCVFDNQIEVESEAGPFSLGGDSGALISTAETQLAVGLLFAGSDQGGRGGFGMTYANPVPDVMDRLGIELL